MLTSIGCCWLVLAYIIIEIVCIVFVDVVWSALVAQIVFVRGAVPQLASCLCAALRVHLATARNLDYSGKSCKSNTVVNRFFYQKQQEAALKKTLK